MKPGAIFALILFSVPGFAVERQSAAYAVFGVGKVYSDFKGDSSTSKYEGGSVEAEVGLDWLWTKQSGLNLAATYSDAKLTNKGNSPDASESGSLKAYGARAGIFSGPFVGGLGMRQLKLDANSVSINSSSETSVSGTETYAYLGLTFNIRDRYRSEVEFSYGKGTASGLDTTTSMIVLRFGILQDFN